MPMRYWSAEDLARRDQIRSFRELGHFGVDVLRKAGQPLCQVCGPISTGGFGNFETNMLVFQRTIEVLLCRGYNMFNQLPLQEVIIRLCQDWRKQNGNTNEYCWPILEEVYAPLFESGCIELGCFIPNWETSEGTFWEHQKIGELGIKRFYVPEDWLFFNVTL